MSTRLRGSVLTCAMLARGDKQVLCAVSNESDEQAMASIDSTEYDSLKPEFFKVVVTISRIKRLLIFAVVALLQDLVLSDPQAYSSLPLDYPSVWDFQL